MTPVLTKPSPEPVEATDRFQLRYSFRHGDHTLRVERRVENVVLLTRSKPKIKWVGFEVAVLQKRHPATLPNGTHYPGGLAMPSNEQWGTHGWSYASKEDALVRFNALVEDPVHGRRPFAALRGWARIDRKRSQGINQHPLPPTCATSNPGAKSHLRTLP